MTELADFARIVAAFAGLFLVSFFFSGTETAFFSLQEIDRRRIAEGRTSTHRRIRAVLSRPTGLITTILIGNETANVAISATAAGLVAVLAPDAPWAPIVLVTPALVLFSEITPKVLAYRFKRLWIDLAIWPLTAVFWLLTPVRALVAGLVQLLAWPFGVTRALTDEHSVGEEEFLVYVREGSERGAIGDDERELIEAVFDLDDVVVSRVMTPSPDIFRLPLEIGWDDLLTACQDARFSRVPIYGGDPEDIAGVLLVKDLLRHRRTPLRGPEDLRRLLLAPVFVPPSKPANEMMREMITRRIHMAFVVDEHGTLMGLVSLDDLIVELVGEIADEFTDEDAVVDYVREPDGTCLVRAAVDLEDLEEDLGLALPEGEYHTLGGFVSHTLGRIPEVGDHVDTADHRIEVVEVDGRRVNQLRLVPLPGDHEEATS